MSEGEQSREALIAEIIKEIVDNIALTMGDISRAMNDHDPGASKDMKERTVEFENLKKQLKQMGLDESEIKTRIEEARKKRMGF